MTNRKRAGDSTEPCFTPQMPVIEHHSDGLDTLLLYIPVPQEPPSLPIYSSLNILLSRKPSVSHKAPHCMAMDYGECGTVVLKGCLDKVMISL